MTRVLVTRPEPSAAEFSSLLDRAGFETLIAPMTKYVAKEADFSDLDSFDAAVLTSPQGATLFGAAIDDREKLIFAVGDATAEAAKRAGFKNVFSAKGDGRQIAELIGKKKEELHLQKLLHPCGEDTAMDLSVLLAPMGLVLERRVLYKAEFLQSLPDAAYGALKDGKIDAVTLFSARTAANFIRLLQERELRGQSARMDAICISDRVAAEIKDIPWRSIRVARRPTTDAMIAALQNEMEMTFPPLAADPVIDLFGGIRPLAHRLSITASTVQGWKERGIIPETRVEAILEAARIDGLDTALLWQPRKKIMTAEAEKSSPSAGDRRQKDRRQEHAPRDARGQVHGRTYVGMDRRTGLDRRAYEKLQYERVLKEKIRFLNRMIITGSFVFIVVVLAGVFLMAPEYQNMKMAAEKTALPPLAVVTVPPETPETPIGAKVHHAIENVETATKETIKMVTGGDIRPFLQVMHAMEVMRKNAGSLDDLSRAVSKVRGILLETPDDPAAVSAALEAAKGRDPAVARLMGNVRSEDLAAAAMLMVLNEFRANVSGQKPYAEDLALLKKYAGDDPELQMALKRLSPYAESGVMSRKTLEREFKGLATDIVMAKLEGKPLSVQEQAEKRLQKLITVRRVGDVKGGETDAVVARAQLMLESGDVEGALRELQSLDGAAAQKAEPWMQNAAGYVLADQSSDALTEAVLSALGGDAQFTIDALFNAVKQTLGGGAAVPYVSPALQNGKKAPSTTMAP